MIRTPTVLVLGAGASAPYGFPCARDLLLEICGQEQGGRFISDPVRHLLAIGWPRDKVDSFIEKLAKCMLPSVDAFLEKNPEHIPVGKAAIAAALIPYENPTTLRPRKEKRWYEHLFDRMQEDATSCDDFRNNRLSIVTLNYDRSIEYFLLTALKSTYGGKEKDAVDLLKSIPIIHVYGQLGKPAFLAQDGRDYTPTADRWALRNCVPEIKIMPEQSLESDEFDQARELISEAEVLCFLGFGYHSTNVKRLQINDQTFSGGRLLGSAYGLKTAEQERVRFLVAGTKGSKLWRRFKLGGEFDDALDFLRKYPVFH